jgi:hypothetical protein
MANSVGETQETEREFRLSYARHPRVLADGEESGVRAELGTPQ